MEKKINNLIAMIERYEHPSATFPYEDNDFKTVDQHTVKDGKIVIKSNGKQVQVQYITLRENIYCIDYNGHIMVGCNKESAEIRERTLYNIIDHGALNDEPFVSVEEELRVFRMMVVMNNYIMYKKVVDVE